MTAFSAFYPFIVPDMPGCPEVGIDLALRQVSNDFCLEGWVYRVETEEVVVEDDERITPALSTGTQLVGVVSATKNNNTAFYAFTVDGDDIVLNNAATEDYDLTLTLALKKPLTATDVPDVLYRDHLDAIVAGVKARLFASPGKSWADPKLAGHYENMYRQELSRYTLKAFRDRSGCDTIRRNGPRFV